jgi:1-acyl-sn-glycerol-3-phosphate acyltransferase
VCKGGTVIREFIGRAVLRVTRWRAEGTAPDDPKYVLIAAPHTSNWDLLYLLALSFALGVKVSWLGKDSLFKGPMGFVLRRFGGVPVRRGQRTGMVESLATEFERAQSLVVVIPPEATRGTTDHWKSGFYRVAVAAQVPIVCGYLDYGPRVGGFGRVVWPTGDLDADMAVFRSFYADIQGKYPDNVGEVRFRTEERDELSDVR